MPPIGNHTGAAFDMALKWKAKQKTRDKPSATQTFVQMGLNGDLGQRAAKWKMKVKPAIR